VSPTTSDELGVGSAPASPPPFEPRPVHLSRSRYLTSLPPCQRTGSITAGEEIPPFARQALSDP